jgi:hypothetical protein
LLFGQQFNPEDGGSTFHRDVDELLPEYHIPVPSITIAIGTSNPTKFFLHGLDILLAPAK